MVFLKTLASGDGLGSDVTSVGLSGVLGVRNLSVVGEKRNGLPKAARLERGSCRYERRQMRL